MSDSKGPITLITDLSEKRNRWKALAFAWRSAAVSAVRGCSICGSPSLWRVDGTDTYWCQTHRDAAPPDEAREAIKLPWYQSLSRALELEDDLAQDL